MDEDEDRDRDEPSQGEEGNGNKPTPLDQFCRARHARFTWGNRLRQYFVVEQIVVEGNPTTDDGERQGIRFQMVIFPFHSKGEDQYQRVHENSLEPAEDARWQIQDVLKIETTECGDGRADPGETERIVTKE